MTMMLQTPTKRETTLSQKKEHTHKKKEYKKTH